MRKAPKILSERIGIASLILLGFFSLFGWYTLFHETFFSYVGGTLSLLLGFSFACVFFFLGSILWYKRWEMFLGSVLMFLPALFFAPIGPMFIAVGLASLLAFIAILSIHLEKRQRIHFQYFRINQAGQFYFIVGLSLAIATAYFVIIRTASWEELVPRFRLGQGTAGLIIKSASIWQPELQGVNQNRLSVDEYLLRLAESKNHPENLERPDGTPARTFELELSLVPGMEARLAERGLGFSDIENYPEAEEYYLVSGRTQLSELAGRSIGGHEPIALVFSEVLQRRLIETLQSEGDVSTAPVEAVPLVLSIVLFLALIPVGTLLSYAWLLVGYLVFLFLLKTEQMEIREHLDEVEELQVTEN